MNGPDAEVRVGNCLPLENIPVGTEIHNIELYPGKGGQLVRSAGNSAQLMAKENGYATLRLPSGEMRMVPLTCRATIGSIGNAVAVTLMFIVGPLGVTGWGYVACMLVFYFLWDTFFTMNDIGYWSMLPSLTNDPTERAKLTTNVTVATTIGAFVMNMMMSSTTPPT